MAQVVAVLISCYFWLHLKLRSLCTWLWIYLNCSSASFGDMLMMFWMRVSAIVFSFWFYISLLCCAMGRKLSSAKNEKCSQHANATFWGKTFLRVTGAEKSKKKEKKKPTENYLWPWWYLIDILDSCPVTFVMACKHRRRLILCFSALSHPLGDFVSDSYGYHEFAT